MDEELELIVKEYTSEQLTTYIQRLEKRISNTLILVSELKKLRRRKFKKKPLDTGAPRGGK